MRRVIITAALAGLALVPVASAQVPGNPTVLHRGVMTTAFTPDYQRPFVAGGGEIRKVNPRASAVATVSVYAGPVGQRGLLKGYKTIRLSANRASVNASARVLVPCTPVRRQTWSYFTTVITKVNVGGRVTTIKAKSHARNLRCRPA